MFGRTLYLYITRNGLSQPFLKNSLTLSFKKSICRHYKQKLLVSEGGLTNEEIIRKELNSLKKSQVIRSLVFIKGWKESTLNTLFSRGMISKKLAPDLEEVTGISALFWMRPDIYNKKGERL